MRALARLASIVEPLRIRALARLAYTQDQPRDEQGRFSFTDAGDVNITRTPENLVESGRKGGFTYQPVSHDSPTHGFAYSPYKGREVSVDPAQYEDDDEFEAAVGDAIDKAMTDNADVLSEPGHYLGGWVDEDDGKLYFDVSVVEQDFDKAMADSKANDQIALWSLHEGREYRADSDDRPVDSKRGEASEVAASRHGPAQRDRGREARVREAHGSGCTSCGGQAQAPRLASLARLAYTQDQPRDDHGRWTDGGGSVDSDQGTLDALTISGLEASARGGGPVVHSAEEALDRLERGEPVTLPRGEVSVFLDKLQERVLEAKEKGEEAPNINLCDVTVPDASIFCAENQGIPRIEMPQLRGDAVPGSWAEEHGERVQGQVSIEGAFREHLRDQGVGFADETVPASHLKATQNELAGDKVAGILGAYDRGEFDPTKERIFVSSDDYVLDGHHRWAAAVGKDYDDARAGDIDMQIIRVDMPITALLLESNQFANDRGIAQQGTRTKGKGIGGSVVYLARLAHLATAESGKTQAHDEKGLFTSGDGGGDTMVPDHVIAAGNNNNKLEQLIQAAPDTHIYQKPEALTRAEQTMRSAVDADPELLAWVDEHAYLHHGYTQDEARDEVIASVAPDPTDWVRTAADGSVDSLLTQQAADREFDDGALNDYIYDRLAVTREDGGIAKAEEALDLRGTALRAEYDHTQAWLRDQGIGPDDPVKLYRGDERDFYGPGVPGERAVPMRGDTIQAELNPLSSWSTSSYIAEGFATSGGTVLSVEIPAKDIFSTAATGWGSHGEYEVIVLGHDGVEAKVEDHYGYSGSVTAATKRKRSIRLDDPENEDWIKRVPGHVGTITVRVADFDESEHPRDERGRFTSGGGGGQESDGSPQVRLVREPLAKFTGDGAQLGMRPFELTDEARAARAEAIAAYSLDFSRTDEQIKSDAEAQAAREFRLFEALPNAERADLSGIYRRYQEVITTRTEKFAEDYKFAASRIIEVVPTDSYQLGDARTVARTGWDIDTGMNHLEFNTDVYGDPKDLERGMATDFALGYHLYGVKEGIGATTDHELGHVLDNSFREVGNSNMECPSCPSGAAPFSAANVSEHLGGYAEASSREAFAEAFAMERIGMDVPSIFVNELTLTDARAREMDSRIRAAAMPGFRAPRVGRIIWSCPGFTKHEYAHKPKLAGITVRVAEYDDSQPRDDHGRWTSGGGGGEIESDLRSSGGNTDSGSRLDRMPQAQREVLLAKAAEYGLDPVEMRARAEVYLDTALDDPEIQREGEDWYGQMQDQAHARADEIGYDREEFVELLAATSPRMQWETADGSKQPNMEAAALMARMLDDNPHLRDMAPEKAAAEAAKEGWLSSSSPYSTNGGRVMETIAEQAFGRIKPDNDYWPNKTGAFKDQLLTAGNGDTAVIDTRMMAALAGAPETVNTSDKDLAPNFPGKALERGFGGSPKQKAEEGFDPEGSIYDVFADTVADVAYDRGMRISDAQALIWVAQKNERVDPLPAELRR